MKQKMHTALFIISFILLPISIGTAPIHVLEKHNDKKKNNTYRFK